MRIVIKENTATQMLPLQHDAAPDCLTEKRVFGGTACAGRIAEYLRRYPDAMDRVFRTLSYVDVMNFADHIRCPVLASCGLKDTATPPECVYAAYNKITSEKTIRNYPFGGHAIEPPQVEKALAWVRAHFAEG